MKQPKPLGAAALIPNPALAPLAFLIGDWRTTGSHPAVPGKSLAGRTSFAWTEGGAFLAMHSEVDDPAFPSGVAIIGTDDAAGTFTMSYFDERKISRRYDITVGKRSMTWHRHDTKLAQIVRIAAGADGDTLQSTGSMSQDGGAWQDDLSQVFRRA